MKNLSTLSLFIIGLLSFHCLAAQDNHRLTSLNKVVDTLLQRNEFNGTLLYAVNGKIQFEKSFGNLSLSDKTPIDKSSSFNLASLTKQFIGLLALKVKEKYPFSLDDPAVDDGDAYGRTVTIAKPAGNYTVNAAVSTAYVVGAINCTPAANAVVDLPNRRVTLRMSAGGAVSCTFVIQRRSTVTGVKFNDLNGNGLRASTEPFLNGWTMKLYSAQGVLAATRVTTDVVSGGVTTAGRATFASLVPGNYVLCEQLTAGWRNTRPTSTNPAYENQPCTPLVVEPGRSYTVLFGNRQGVAASDVAADETVAPAPDNVFTDTLLDTDEEGEESSDLPPVWLPEEEEAALKVYLPLIR